MHLTLILIQLFLFLFPLLKHTNMHIKSILLHELCKIRIPLTYIVMQNALSLQAWEHVFTRLNEPLVHITHAPFVGKTTYIISQGIQIDLHRC